MFEDIQRCAIAAVNLVYACHSKQYVSEKLQSLEFSLSHIVPCFSQTATTLGENTAFIENLSAWKKSPDSGPKSDLDNANDIIKNFNIILAQGKALVELIQPLINLLSALQTLLHSESKFIQNEGELKGGFSVNGILAKYDFYVNSYTQRESLSNVLNGTIIFLENYKNDSSEINVKCFLNAFSYLQTWPTIANPNKEKISKLASQIHKKAVSAQPEVAKSARTKELPILSDNRNRVFSQLGKRSPISVTAPVYQVSSSNREKKSSQNVKL